MDVSDISVKVPSTASVDKTTEAVAIPARNALPLTGHAHTRTDNVHTKQLFDQPDPVKLKGLVDQANKALEQHNNTLKFSIAKGTNIRVIKIIDTETGQVIRQIPSEQMVAIAKALRDIKSGAVLEDKA